MLVRMLLQIVQRRACLLRKPSACNKFLTVVSQHGTQVRCGFASSLKEDLVVHKLRSRGLVQLKGQDVVPFLQGLVTSDVALLGPETNAQFSMLLNVQGRVMYDLLLYDTSIKAGEPAILMECDRELTEKLMSDIKRYKIRKKVVIDNISDSQSVLATFGTTPEMLSGHQDVIVSTADPRVPSFGTRIITSSDTLKGCSVVNEEEEYHRRRLQWGIPEGPQDLPPGNCFPLESNLVFMNGVSFSKGCYLGQELTARTHHTGVTRKRLMPLVFSQPPAAEDIELGSNIQNAKGKSVGKIRSVAGLYGIGLMRMAEAIGELTVQTKSGSSLSVTAIQPDWWPQGTS